MGQANPLISTWTPPRVVATLPVESRTGKATAVAGPMGCVGSLAKRVMISPGAMEPVAKLAALVTLEMVGSVGSGVVTFSITLTVVVPDAPAAPATSMVPL